ncbi:MAG: site-2 protease family protein [Candidatus Woesearchaeota archaeon]
MLSFDVIALIVLVSFLSIFLYKKREDVDVEKILFPFLYMVMYRAKWGIKFMSNFAKKHKKFLNVLQYLSIGVGVIGVLFISVLLIITTVDLIKSPTETVQGVGIVLPVETSWSFYVPFMYFILCITYLMIVHEGMHGIFMRYFGLKIKNTGFAFFSFLLPILPGAFVEPDEEELENSPLKDKLAILAGGSFANIISAFMFLLISFLLVSASNPFTESDIRITNVIEDAPAYHANVTSSLLHGITYNDTYYETNNLDEFLDFTENFKPNETLILHTNESNKSLILSNHPEHEDRGYMGLNFESEMFLKEEYSQFQIPFNAFNWIMGLLFWLFLINFGVGTFNLLPMGPVDGGQMLRAVLEKYTSEKRSKIIFSVVSWFFFGLVLLNIFYPIFF